MVATVPADPSERLFHLLDKDDVVDWLHQVSETVGGLRWVPLGGIENNVHSVEVMRESGSALVERVTNAIDAMLDLPAQLRHETAASPHEGAARWFNIPPAGLSELPEPKRREVADSIRVTNYDSGAMERPTVVIQDLGTGQHPDDFASTLLSLLGSNKKSKTHQMGVYNAGGAGSYYFCPFTIIASRKHPSLLDGRHDEVGVTVVRYNPLDPDKFKTGTYEYCVAMDGSVLRLDLAELPDLPYGAYVKHVSYELSSYGRAAYEPKRSLWHLLHAALPDPALPCRIVETRQAYFPGLKGEVERRVVMGLLHLLRRKGTADYSDERGINMGPDGSVWLRYFVLNEGIDPDAYVTAEQGLAFTLNGQRQDTRDRYWVKRNTGYNYIFKRLLIIIDGNPLTSAAKREVFASTREASKDSPLTRRILERAIQELKSDEELQAIDEEARQRTIAEATRSTSERVKRQLASQVAHLLQGKMGGKSGGIGQRTKKPRRAPKPRNYDDSLLLEVPDQLEIVSDPVHLPRGKLSSVGLRINAKNDFLPRHIAGLSIVLAVPLKDYVVRRSVGRLLGGRCRLTLETSSDAPLGDGSIQVALVVPELGLLLTATARASVEEPPQDKPGEREGGEPDVEISWHDRPDWDKFEPHWDEQTAGSCVVTRDPADPEVITRVDWHLNKAFAPYERIVTAKHLTDSGLKTFQEAYELPVCWAFFNQHLAEYEKERQADEEGRSIEIPDDYVNGERARIARSVLLAKEPEVAAAEALED